MLFEKTAGFSSDGQYFALYGFQNTLFVWETLTNTRIIDYDLKCNVYGACSTLLWIPLEPQRHSPKKAKLTNFTNDSQLIALGTSRGDILVYNVIEKNLLSHLRGQHMDSINDLAFCGETDSFFTCSRDKCIAVWDMTTGRQKSKWITEESVSSMCVLDGNNLLTAYTSILWWNIKEKTVLKKFAGHSTEIFKIIPVSVDQSLQCCYVLSAATGDSGIKVWSLNSSDSCNPVASFVSSGLPRDMDILKDRSLVLTVTTKEGNFNLFEHILNGNVNQSVYPKMTINMTLEPNHQETGNDLIMSPKLSSDSKSCVVAYGTCKDSMVFKTIDIRQPCNGSVSSVLCSGDISPQTALNYGDTELISNCVKNLPARTIKNFLEEFSNRLQHNQQCSYNMLKWVREILRIHLPYFIENEDTEALILHIKELMKTKKIPETLSRLTSLKALLNLSVQFASGDESDSEV